MIIDRDELFTTDAPLRRQVRSPEWFAASFRRMATRLMAQHQLAVTVDEAKMRAAFERWHASFLANRDLAGTVRRDFILYMAGIVARELVEDCPLSVQGGRPDQSDTELGRIVSFWPEGYCIFRYCAEICRELLADESLDAAEFDEAAQSLATWWSLRENVAEHPGWSVPFLQRLMRERPNWDRIDAPPVPGAGG